MVQLYFAFQCSCFWVLDLARARANWSPIALSFGQKNPDLSLLNLGCIGSRDGILPKWRPSGLRQLGEEQSVFFSPGSKFLHNAVEQRR